MLFSSFVYERVACKDDGKDNDNLVKRHTEDMLDHFMRNNILISRLRFPPEEFLGRRFSGQGQGTQRVHDQVQP